MMGTWNLVSSFVSVPSTKYFRLSLSHSTANVWNEPWKSIFRGNVPSPVPSPAGDGNVELANPSTPHSPLGAKWYPLSTVPGRFPGPPLPLPYAAAMSISPPTGQHASRGTAVSGTGSIQCCGQTPGHEWSGNCALISTRPYVCEKCLRVSTQQETNGYSDSCVRSAPGTKKKSSPGLRLVRIANAPPATRHSLGSYHCCCPPNRSKPGADALDFGVHLVKSSASPSNSSLHVSCHPSRCVSNAFTLLVAPTTTEGNPPDATDSFGAGGE
mmetsp:Transcript_12156/g.52234  ORF Transcript_12156/g.52234 Transcript_12156/m.52234 type:complete len:270 (+) Transcript_12156:720-1529(+)